VGRSASSPWLATLLPFNVIPWMITERLHGSLFEFLYDKEHQFLPFLLSNPGKCHWPMHADTHSNMSYQLLTENCWYCFLELANKIQTNPVQAKISMLPASATFGALETLC